MPSARSAWTATTSPLRSAATSSSETVGRERVTKGASYMNGRAEQTPTRRIEGGPDGRNANVGFRLARTVVR